MDVTRSPFAVKRFDLGQVIHLSTPPSGQLGV